MIQKHLYKEIFGIEYQHADYLGRRVIDGIKGISEKSGIMSGMKGDERLAAALAASDIEAFENHDHEAARFLAAFAFTELLRKERFNEAKEIAKSIFHGEKTDYGQLRGLINAANIYNQETGSERGEYIIRGAAGEKEARIPDLARITWQSQWAHNLKWFAMNSNPFWYWMQWICIWAWFISIFMPLRIKFPLLMVVFPAYFISFFINKILTGIIEKHNREYEVYNELSGAAGSGENAGDKYHNAAPSSIKNEPDILITWKTGNIERLEDGAITAMWQRDKYGNITSAGGDGIIGYEKSRLVRGGKEYASAKIHYVGDKIGQDEIIWFRGNRSAYAKVSVSEGLYLQGDFELYYSGGDLKKSGWLEKGRPVGLMKIYYRNGAQKALLRYKDGRRHGNYERYHSNGGIKETGAYEGGKLHGYVLGYYADGMPAYEEYYRNGHMLSNTVFGMGGVVLADTVIEKAVKEAGGKDAELKGLRRLAKVRMKLGRYGLEMFEPGSDMFPRERAVRIVGSEYVLRQFSCEEELIKAVLNKEKFEEILERREARKSGKKTVWHYNEKGRLVRE
jgi:hypothetical protein